MKSDLPFDQSIRERFSDTSVEVPPHILENILAARKHSKPKGFWLKGSFIKSSIGLGIALIITGGIYLSGAFDAKQTDLSENSNSEKSDNKSTAPITNTNPDITAPTEEIKDQVVFNERTDQSLAKQSVPENRILTGSSVKGNVTHQTDQQQNIASHILNPNQDQISEVSGFLNFPFLINNERKLQAGTSNNSPTLKLPDCPTIESNAAGNKKYLEVYAGPDHIFGNYKTFGDTASYNYLQKRKASTRIASAFSAGVRYTKVFNNGMSVRTGINYSQINEKFNYVNTNEIRYTTVITTRAIIRSPGDTLFVYDTLQFQQSGTRIKTTNNRYRTIDVPLVIGYELGNGRIHANINAGVIVNVYSWYKGDVLDTTSQPVSITTGKGNSAYQYKTNIGVGFLGSASVYYKLNDKFHLLLEPYFRYNLAPMSQDRLNLQQRFHTAGIRAGVRMDLK